MLIHWLGESCFLIETLTGRRILLDPSSSDLNKLIELNPSIITISHDHHHSIIASLTSLKQAKILNSTGSYEINNIKISGYLTYHDKLEGLKRGENIIFILEIDNIKICHLGHLGHMLSKSLVAQLNNVDILLIPIGGHFSIGYIEALNIIKEINPKFVIPMYYKTSNSLLFLDSPNLFITKTNTLIIVKSNILNTQDLNQTHCSTTILLREKTI